MPTDSSLTAPDDKSVQRFWKKVNRGLPDECWPWTGGLMGAGYGNFWYPPKYVSAHRFSLLLHRQVPLRTGWRTQADHLCRNRACVNPAHLEMVTAKENVRRAEPFRETPRAFCRRPLASCCARGHEFDEHNTLWYRGYRYCRPCRRIRQKKSDGAK